MSLSKIKLKYSFKLVGVLNELKWNTKQVQIGYFAMKEY